MKYRLLGNSGMSVSTLTLGTMGFGTETPEKEAFAILDAFCDAGGNIIDTADVYGGGASEAVIGRWRSSRSASVTDRVIVATKARFGTGPDMNDAGLSRRHLTHSLNASLKTLGVDAIDLYQLHGWDPLTPPEQTLMFLADAVRAGKIHHIGLSNFTGWQLQLMLSTARMLGTSLPVTLQQQYSLACRESEYEVIPASLHNQISLLPWSPLAHGFFSGKYTRGTRPGAETRLGSDNAMFRHIGNDIFSAERNWSTLKVVQRIADDTGFTPSQVALSWVTNRPSVASSIIGVRTLDQFSENIKAADLILEEGLTQELDTVSAPVPDDYPYGRFGTLQRERYIDSSDQVLREL